MKRPLVFIQGWGFDERIWEEFIDEYFTDYEVEKINIFDFFEDNLNANDLLETICNKLITSIKQNEINEFYNNKKKILNIQESIILFNTSYSIL